MSVSDNLLSSQQVDDRTFDSVNNAISVSLVGQSANTSVQRVSAGFMAPGQTAKAYVGITASITSAATTVTLQTTTTGKTFYITDIHISTDSTTPLPVSIKAAGIPIFNAYIQNTAPLDMSGMETQPFATSTQVVTLVLPQTVAVQNYAYVINGFEQ